MNEETPPLRNEHEENYEGDRDFYYDRPPDPFQQAIDNCHMLPDGVCMAAGSEHCDFDCPVAAWYFGEALP